MLKHLKFLMLLVLPFSLAMTLTSCSDDDNENLEDGNEETSLLVGSWEERLNGVTSNVWTFNSDGTCKIDNFADDGHLDVGKYSYNSSTGILLMSMICEANDETITFEFKVLQISSSELVLQGYDEEDGVDFNLIFTRKI